MSRKLVAIELAAAVTMTVIATLASGLRCYKCTTTRPSSYRNETVRLCSEFDFGAKYEIECPYSTFCKKRYFTTKYPNSDEVVNATERDCASQKRVTQNFVNGKWQQEFIIEEPYQQGCQLVDTKGAKTTSTLDCYCKGDLCNDSVRLILSNAVILVVILHIMYIL